MIGIRCVVLVHILISVYIKIYTLLYTISCTCSGMSLYNAEPYDFSNVIDTHVTCYMLHVVPSADAPIRARVVRVQVRTNKICQNVNVSVLGTRYNIFTHTHVRTLISCTHNMQKTKHDTRHNIAIPYHLALALEPSPSPLLYILFSSSQISIIPSNYK